MDKFTKVIRAMYAIALLFLGVLLGLGCSKKPEVEKEAIVPQVITAVAVSTAIDSTVSAPKADVILTKRSVCILFDKTKNFSVLNAERSITTQSSAPDTAMCAGWAIPVGSVATIIKGCVPVDPMDWHHEFDVLPCIVTGTLVQGGRNYTYELNAGSWLYVSCGDSTMILGSYAKEAKRYCLSSAWTGDEVD
jgi:hypothetical protein